MTNEERLTRAGYVIVGLPDETWLCADPTDDQDGFSLIESTREACINESADALLSMFFDTDTYTTSPIYVP